MARGKKAPTALQGASGPPDSNQVRADGALGDQALDLEPGYLPSAMTPMPPVLSVRRCLMARYSGESYQALADRVLPQADEAQVECRPATVPGDLEHVVFLGTDRAVANLLGALAQLGDVGEQALGRLDGDGLRCPLPVAAPVLGWFWYSAWPDLRRTTGSTQPELRNAGEATARSRRRVRWWNQRALA
jgi:hypothetical protein